MNNEKQIKIKPLCIVLVSGGMDSLVVAAIANLENELAFLHLNYGQRTEVRELKAFNDIADFYGVKKRLVVDVRYLKEIGGSALTDKRVEVPTQPPSIPPLKKGGEGGIKKEGQGGVEIPITYVPFRNAHLLSIAVSWAEVIGAKKVYIGAVEEDSSGYPDCREVFYKAFGKAIDAGTRPETKVEIITPLIHMKKSAIVKKGIELEVPFHLTWSCYKNNDIACGECDSCRLRLKGFKGAGVEDPIKYREVGGGR